MPWSYSRRICCWAFSARASPGAGLLLVGVFVPVVEWLAYYYLCGKTYAGANLRILLAFVPGIAGAYGGAVGRGVVDNLFPKK
jgi:hypothetical protein